MGHQITRVENSLTIHAEDRKHYTAFKGTDPAAYSKQDAVQFSRGMGYRETGMSHNEISLLYDMLEKRKPRLIVELGRNHGCSTRLFLQYLSRNEAFLDSWDLQHFTDFYEKMDEIGFPLKQDEKATFGKGGYILRKAHSIKHPAPDHFEFWGIDFILIDTEHGIEDAVGEYMRFRPYLASGAIVAFHDSTLPAVARAIEMVREIENWGGRKRIAEELAPASEDGFGIHFLRMA